QRGDAYADSISHGVRDRCARRNHRRLTQADHAPLVVTWPGHHVYHEFADIADAGKFVEFHVGVEHATRLCVHDLLFVERVADAHDKGTVTLAFSGFQVDDQAAVLRGNHAVDPDDARLGIHGDVRHLDAAHAAGVELALRVARLLTLSFDRLHSQLGTRLFPGEALGRIALHADLPINRLQLVRLRAEIRRHYLEQFVARVNGAAPGGTAYPAHGGAAARRAVGRILAVANLDLYGIERQTQRLSHDNVDDGSSTGPKVL